MDQIKIGNYLKELRKEKDLTQEQLAEYLSVSRRTISRWETGRNLPDLDLLIELADFYEVDLRDLIDGERVNENMDKELKETVLKVANYSNEEKDKMNSRVNVLFVIGLIANIIPIILRETEWRDSFLIGLCQGFALGMMVVGIIMTSSYAHKFKEIKQRLLRRLKQ